QPYFTYFSQARPVVEADPYFWQTSQTLPVVESDVYFWRMAQTMPVVESISCAQPSDCAAACMDGLFAIRVSWTDNSSDGKARFVVQRRPAAGGSWTTVKVTLPGAEDILDTTIQACVLYEYRVAAWCTDDPTYHTKWSYSNTADCCYFTYFSQIVPVVETFTLPPPTDCTVWWDEDKDCMIIEWTDNSLGEWGFVIERRVGGGVWVQLAEVPKNIEYLEDCTAIPGVTYQYRIAARYYGTGYSSWCTTVVVVASCDFPNVNQPFPAQVWEDEKLEGSYSVVVRGTDGTSLTLVDAYERLEYAKILNDQGFYTLRFYTSVIDPDDFGLDHLVSVMRKPPGTTWIEDFTGMHRWQKFDRDNRDREVFRSRGPGLMNLIKRPIVLPSEGEGFLTISGAFTDLMRELVRTQCGSDVEDPDREFPGLTVQTDTHEGVELNDMNYRYDNLYEVVDTLAGLGADFEIVRNEAATFTFIVHYEQQGLDCRVDNGDGNPPVIFSEERGNMSRPEVTDDRLEEKTVVYVGGAGPGENREIVKRTSLVNAQNDSPWNRVESFKDARAYENTAALMAIGDSFLWTNKESLEFTCDVKPTPNCLYNIDWDLGYLVTGYHREYEYDLQVVEVHVVVDENGEHISPVFKVVGWNKLGTDEGWSAEITEAGGNGEYFA
ncbi:hypothetical protein GF373_17830, partial [bacterium]|nr:hypothetical protein [bacterium]